MIHNQTPHRPGSLPKGRDANRHEMPKPLVSVTAIIVNYNGGAFLLECIQSLYNQTCSGLEILVVDNNSSDQSIADLVYQFPKVKIIRNIVNLGYSGGLNKGICTSSSPFVMALNSDTCLDPDCIKHLVTAITSDNSLGMCAPKMLFPDGRINSTGICISRSGAAWDRGMFEIDNGQYDEREEIIGPCGGAALFRRKMLDDVGLFDEDFFMYMEDVDIALRGQLAGWKCLYVPEALVFHHNEGTSRFRLEMTVYYGNRNILWYPMKDFPVSLLVLSLPWMIGRFILTIPYYLLKGQGNIILKSKIDSLIGLPGMIRKRRSIKRRLPIKDFQKLIKLFYRIS